MYSCHFILECCGLFLGVKLSIRSFVLFICLKLTSYLVQSFMGQQVAMVIEVSLCLLWGPSYHSNKICGLCPLFQETWVPNINSI